DFMGDRRRKQLKIFRRFLRVAHVANHPIMRRTRPLPGLYPSRYPSWCAAARIRKTDRKIRSAARMAAAADPVAEFENRRRARPKSRRSVTSGCVEADFPS